MKRLFTPIFVVVWIAAVCAQTKPAKMSPVGNPVLSESEIIAKQLPDGRFCAGIKIISDLEGFSYDSYLGITALDEPYGKTGVVSQYGSDADEHGVEPGAQLMAQYPGFR